MNNPNNRKVKVTFKSQNTLNPVTGEAEAHTRPPFYTTEHNLDHVKRIHGKIIKEIAFADEEIVSAGRAIVEQKPKVVEKIVEKVVTKEPTDSDLIIALHKKGKSSNSIARTLEIPIGDVESVLQDNNVGATA